MSVKIRTKRVPNHEEVQAHILASGNALSESEAREALIADDDDETEVEVEKPDLGVPHDQETVVTTKKAPKASAKKAARTA